MSLEANDGTSVLAKDDVHAESQKSATQLKKEAKRQAKLDKFSKKQENLKVVSKTTEEEKVREKSKKEPNTSIPIIYSHRGQPGDKKDTSNPIPDAYSPMYVEAGWYEWWEKQGFFKPEYAMATYGRDNPNGKFVICIPPPNVTGSLHIGHALTCAIQDCLSRWHRMNGKTVLWNPGCDHAGIATQVVVEKRLKRETNQSRHDLGRQMFLEEVWKWKAEKGDRIYEQMKKLGISVDWDRARFTMDPKPSRAVVEAFVRLHERGLVYRAYRLVNWSCALNSAISDIEVEKVELNGRTLLQVPGYSNKIEFGVLVHFSYMVEGSDEKITVATTRVETMLGDTGIAVYPDDARYKHLHGRFAFHPFCDRKLRIVPDTSVDPNFGTGAVKVTPAHDHNDYEIGKRHALDTVTIFEENGCIKDFDIKPAYRSFVGMKRFEARRSVLEALKSVGLYIKTEDHAMVVPVCSRSKDIVEPLLKSQWYVSCEKMAASAVEAVRSGSLKLTPSVHEKIWYNWLENCRDWCISRQLWWGHQVPAYYVTVKGVAAGCMDDDANWVSGRNYEDALEKAADQFKVPKDQITLKQDDDVLDTWFSSGLFPFSIFDWPEQTDDLKNFYPTQLLETGHDILFFWVARMVMLGQELTGVLPFNEVFLHAMVRDAHGRKMSKSLGNIVDPLDVIAGISLEDLHKQLLTYNLDPKEVEAAKKGQKEDYPTGIPECGTDALRFTLCAYTAQGRDINLDILRVQGYRFFCNKIWNAFKFALKYLGDDFQPIGIDQIQLSLSRMDQWVLSCLSSAERTCNAGFASYDLQAVTTVTYNFWLYELCDIYLESLKPVFASTDDNAKTAAKNTLWFCLNAGLRLLSPFMPFITEELYQRLPAPEGVLAPSICVAAYPKELPWRNLQLEQDVSIVMDTVKTTRSLKEEYLTTKAKAPVFLVSHEDSISARMTPYLSVITVLTSSENVSLLNDAEQLPSGCAMALVNEKLEVHVLLKGLINVERELSRLDAKKGKAAESLRRLKESITIPDYDIKVPEEVRLQNAGKVNQLEEEISKIELAMSKLTA